MQIGFLIVILLIVIAIFLGVIAFPDEVQDKTVNHYYPVPYYAGRSGRYQDKPHRRRRHQYGGHKRTSPAP